MGEIFHFQEFYLLLVLMMMIFEQTTYKRIDKKHPKTNQTTFNTVVSICIVSLI